MNWHDVLPEQIAINQIAFERRHRVLRAYQAGAKQKDIARYLGCTPGNVHMIIRKALFCAELGEKSPVEKWCEQWLPDMIPELDRAAANKNRRETHWSYKPPPRYTFEPWP